MNTCGSDRTTDAAAFPASGPGATPTKLRRRRAVLARRLQAADPSTAATLTLSELDSAPAWLALGDADLARLALRIGALRHAPMLRMWIDAPRIAAAGAAVGPGFLASLLALPEAQLPLQSDLAQGAPIGRAEQVAPVLRSAGQAVLLASLPANRVRQAMSAAWDSVAPSGMAEELAGMLVAQVESLAARSEPAASPDVPPAPTLAAAAPAQGLPA